MNGSIMELKLNKKEITVEQFNDIVYFINKYSNLYGMGSVKLRVEDFPLRISGNLSLLSLIGQKYYRCWHGRGYIRNISVVKDENT